MPSIPSSPPDRAVSLSNSDEAALKEPLDAARRRVAIVDDDPIVCVHFGEIVQNCPRLELIGTAGSIATARELFGLAPDLFLLDIGLPDGSGLMLVPEIKARGNMSVLVVTSFGDRETVVAAISAGADGYLLKDSDSATVLAGVEATLAGGAPISPAAAVYLLDSLRASPAKTPGSESASLTPRETELLELFARGQSYKEAARSLAISPLSVGNHVKSIYRKLAVNSRGEAVYAAIRSGKLTV